MMSAVAQEYIDSRTTAPDSLRQERSPLSDITGAPEQPEGFRLFRDSMVRPVIDDTEFFIHPRFYYISRTFDGGGAPSRSAAAIGGSFGLRTGWLYDFAQIGLTAYTSVGGTLPGGQDATGLLNDQGDSYIVLGEAYLRLRYEEITGQFFRQELDFPFINTNDSRMTPNTFEAYRISSRENKAFQWGIGHITRIKRRTSTEFVPMSEAAGASGTQDGVTFAGVLFEFEADDGRDLGYFGAINQYGWNTFNTFYTEAEYNWQATDRFDTSFQFQFADQRSTGRELLGRYHAQLLGTEIDFGYESLIVRFISTYSASDSQVRNPWGGTPAFNSLIVSDFNRPGELSLGIGLSYDFADIGLDGLSAFSNVAYGIVPDSSSGGDQREFDFTVDYRPQFDPLKNLWLRFRYARNELDAGPNQNEFRVIINYSLDF